MKAKQTRLNIIRLKLSHIWSENRYPPTEIFFLFLKTIYIQRSLAFQTFCRPISKVIVKSFNRQPSTNGRISTLLVCCCLSGRPRNRELWNQTALNLLLYPVPQSFANAGIMIYSWQLTCMSIDIDTTTLLFYCRWNRYHVY